MCRPPMLRVLSRVHAAHDRRLGQANFDTWRSMRFRRSNLATDMASARYRQAARVVAGTFRELFYILRRFFACAFPGMDIYYVLIGSEARIWHLPPFKNAQTIGRRPLGACYYPVLYRRRAPRPGFRATIPALAPA